MDHRLRQGLPSRDLPGRDLPSRDSSSRDSPSRALPSLDLPHRRMRPRPLLLTSSPNSRERLIVGIDYGTTFSGVSYCTTVQRDMKDITVIQSWPGGSNARKTPTRIAYIEENPHLTQRKWGFQADSKVVSCAWTKLLLDSSSDYQAYDDPLLREETGSGIFHFPKDLRDPEGVCEDFLREIYKHMWTHLRTKYEQEILSITPMDCWLTLPATWSDRAKSATKAAAARAGFGGRPEDRLFTITEPEAAALAALKIYEAGNSLNPIREGENILICDCGGGTVDITTYTIFTTNPLQFDELCVGTGGKCGSTSIDRNLHRLMKTKFGAAFDAVPFAKKGPGSTFMQKFEDLKSDFREGQDDDNVMELILKMDVEESEIYDPDDKSVKLTWQEMKGLFDPVVKKVLELVEDQADKVKKEREGKINRIVLVGGFGDSPYLLQKLREWSSKNLGASVVCPEHPQSAIVIGAALRGLEGLTPSERKSRRHYGVGVGMPFRRGKDPEQFKYKDAATKSDFCSGRVQWLLAKGDVVTKETKKSVPMEIHVRHGQEQVAEMELFSCTLACQPERVDHERVTYIGTIRVNLTLPLAYEGPSRKELRYGGTGAYSISAELQVEFGDDTGVLNFKALVDGRQAGKASIEFD